MTVVLDANVLISAGAGRGLCEAVLECCLGEHDVVSSALVLADVHEKLVKKIRVPDSVADEFVTLLSAHCRLIEAAHVPSGTCRDPDDLHLLGLAAACGALYLVSGDRDPLVLGRFQDTRIVTPRQFWDCMRGE